jgi:hypothetical protein
MKGIAIFVEGGGDSNDQKAELRRGLDALLDKLKCQARLKRLGWKLVPCGGRDSTKDAFLNEIDRGSKDTLCVLLVDSEEGVPHPISDASQNAQSRKDHLIRRDKWQDLLTIPQEQIHLMVQCMEAWIVADSEALAKFYQKNFHPKKLPARQNLEEEPKADLTAKLIAATRDTQKGDYHKTKHAPKLLALLSAEKISARCVHFNILCDWLAAKIDAA